MSRPPPLTLDDRARAAAEASRQVELTLIRHGMTEPLRSSRVTE